MIIFALDIFFPGRWLSLSLITFTVMEFDLDDYRRDVIVFDLCMSRPSQVSSHICCVLDDNDSQTFAQGLLASCECRIIIEPPLTDSL